MNWTKKSIRKELFLPACLFLLLTGCTQPKEYIEDSGSVFHTLYQIRYEAPKPLTKQIDAEFMAFNLSLNPFNPNSIIAKVNNNEPVEVDDWFIEVFNRAKEVSRNSGGMFDATAAPLINAWGFGFNKGESVTPELIDSILPFVGYNKIRLEGRNVVKDDPRIMLNFSAIAKGYACDVIAALLDREGVENYMVYIGGEVVAKGVNQNGQCWRLGINKPSPDPTGENHEIEEIVQPCQRFGLATSGDYRNFYELDGKTYAHTINPITGYPAAQNILSATIITTDCMTADAYATACMALGLEKAVEMVSAHDELAWYFIYMDEAGKHQALFSEQMKSYFLKR